MILGQIGLNIPCDNMYWPYSHWVGEGRGVSPLLSGLTHKLMNMSLGQPSFSSSSSNFLLPHPNLLPFLALLTVSVPPIASPPFTPFLLQPSNLSLQEFMFWILVRVSTCHSILFIELLISFSTDNFVSFFLWWSQRWAHCTLFC